jgi:hypothetical protein
MPACASGLSAEELAKEAFPLYEQFRPEIPAGEKRWGAKGKLDLVLVEHLAKRN